jgi:hypothetical protein
MKNNNFLVCCSLLILTLMSCRDMPVTPDTDDACILTNYNISRQYNSTLFFYNTDKQLVGKVRLAKGRFPISSGIDIAIPVYDTIIYGNNTLTVYSLDIINPFDSINIPNHAPLNKPFEKIIAKFNNGKISTVDYYKVGSASDQLTLNKEIEYKDNRISKIKLKGEQQLCSTTWYAQTEYVYDYLSADTAIILGVYKNLDGVVIGNDTLNVSFFNLKNPLSRGKNVQLIYSNAIFDKIIKQENFQYAYKQPSGFNFCHGYSLSRFIYTDNGKGYPKELGVYKCD